MSYTNESELINTIYDYMFDNVESRDFDFLDNDFSDSYVDTENARIYLNSKEFGSYIIKIEKAT
jgi:hypothetical protein